MTISVVNILGLSVNDNKIRNCFLRWLLLSSHSVAISSRSSIMSKVQSLSLLSHPHVELTQAPNFVSHSVENPLSRHSCTEVAPLAPLPDLQSQRQLGWLCNVNFLIASCYDWLPCAVEGLNEGCGCDNSCTDPFLPEASARSGYIVSTGS
jgi:hypothetical protein